MFEASGGRTDLLLSTDGAGRWVKDHDIELLPPLRQTLAPVENIAEDAVVLPIADSVVGE